MLSGRLRSGTGDGMRFLYILLVAFVVFALVKYPVQSADFVRGIWDVLVAAFHSILTFFSGLMTG
ncbi:MAG TPA: hypothetical protein VMT69_14995 [Kineosporiaceae bacterium]|nr:hypothetical protein [Kineosporiaceae bacterium]